jgi:hypothetical protein
MAKAVAASLFSLLLSFPAQDPGQRLKSDREELAGSWIYDDLNGGFAEAKRSGKPLMIVFR